MTFNTMCDFCKGSKLSEFDERLKSITEIVINTQADIISLQELRSVEQLNTINSSLKDYGQIVTQNLIFSYADPSILYNKKKMELMNSGQFWLGPNSGNLSFGWKLSLPRQVLWARFKYQQTEFLFMSTHIDNRLENMDGSTIMIHDFIKDIKVPIILAGDTNQTSYMPEYKRLTQGTFVNAYKIKNEFNIIGNKKQERDLCYLKKGKVFPECLVDHILFSQSHPFEVKNYTIDISRNFKETFPSDHRAIFIDIKINKLN